MSFEDFENTLKDLVASFKRRSAHGSTEAYDEQSLRNDFLNPFWRSLGWDLENKPSLPQSLRDVQIESRVDVAGKAKRADYIFRTDGISRFVCEAKAAGVDLLPRYAFQAQRYAFNLRVLTAVLTNFKTIQIFLVGAKPQLQAPFFRAKEWQFAEYTEKAREIWDLLSRDAVAGNSLERFIASQRKKPAEGRGRQGWLFAPTRIRTVDEAFLEEIETYRAVLARDLVTWNQGFAWDTYSINEAVQRIIDRWREFWPIGRRPTLFVLGCIKCWWPTSERWILRSTGHSFENTSPRPLLFQTHFYPASSRICRVRTRRISLILFRLTSSDLYMSGLSVKPFIYELGHAREWMWS